MTSPKSSSLPPSISSKAAALSTAQAASQGEADRSAEPSKLSSSVRAGFANLKGAPVAPGAVKGQLATRNPQSMAAMRDLSTRRATELVRSEPVAAASASAAAERNHEPGRIMSDASLSLVLGMTPRLLNQAARFISVPPSVQLNSWG